jgi:predicted aspartyl protease
MVAAAVNGHPLNFMVDTGGVFSAISKQAAQAIGLNPSRLGPNVEMKDISGTEMSSFALIDNITFSHFKAGGIRLMVGSLPPGQDGVLAPDLLRNFDIELDFAGQKMNLFKQPRCDDHVVYWTDDFVKLPLTITQQGHIRIPVMINGAEQKATLDTGSGFTLLGSEYANKLGAVASADGKEMTIIGGGGGREAGTRVTLDSLIIGKFRWLGSQALAVPADAAWRSDGSQLLIGLDIMHDMHLFIDYKGGQIYASKR